MQRTYAPPKDILIPYPSRHARGYGSRWTKLRLVVLRRDKHLCQSCLDQGRVTPATDVDHIKRKADGGTDDLGNLQSLCRTCHHAKSDAEQGRAAPIGEDGWPA